MNLNKLTHSVALAASLAFLSAGCNTGGPKLTPIPGGHGSPGGDTGLDSGLKLGGTSGLGTDATGAHAPTDQGAHKGYAEDATTLQPDIVYFDLDKSAIKSSEQSKLDAVASYLKSNPNKAVRVEGNCDERGTEEYNRSLGERRAIAAREFLINSGIDAGRIDTLTNGEDKPAAQGHSEETWSKNRRDEFIVLTPPGL